jgi:YVTN family beta-propeller protein
MKITTVSLIGLMLALAPSVNASLPANTVVATIPVGSLPTAVVVSPDSSTIYIANSGSNTVSVIDATSNTVVNTFTVALFPTSLAISRDGSTLYVGSLGPAENLQVVSTATGTVTATMKVGNGESLGLALSPDGTQLYDLAGASVCIIDTATNTLVKKLFLNNPIGNTLEFPLNAVFTANGKNVYVNCGINVTLGYTRAAIARIDTASETVVGNIALADEGLGIALDPASNDIYITRRPRSKTETGNCELGVIIPPNDQLASKAFIPHCRANPIAFTPDGKYLYIVATDKKATNSTVLTIETAGKKVVGTPIVVGVGASPIAIAPNGNFAYVVNENDYVVHATGSVSVINIQPN